MYNLKMNTAKEVREALAQLSNDMLNDVISESKYKSFVYGSAQIISSIRTDELETKLNELEALVDDEKNQ